MPAGSTPFSVWWKDGRKGGGSVINGVGERISGVVEFYFCLGFMTQELTMQV